MKRTLIVCMAMMVMATGLAVAQDRPRGGGPGGGPPDAARRVEFMAESLNLSAQQKTDATVIFQAAADASKPFRDKMSEARKALADAVKNNSGDIDQLAANIGTLQGQILAIDSKAEAKFRSALNADQKDKMDTMRFPGGPGGGGPRGGAPRQQQ